MKEVFTVFQVMKMRPEPSEEPFVFIFDFSDHYSEDIIFLLFPIWINTVLEQ